MPASLAALGAPGFSPGSLVLVSCAGQAGRCLGTLQGLSAKVGVHVMCCYRGTSGATELGGELKAKPELLLGVNMQAMLFHPISIFLSYFRAICPGAPLEHMPKATEPLREAWQAVTHADLPELKKNPLFCRRWGGVTFLLRKRRQTSAVLPAAGPSSRSVSDGECG